MCVVLKRRMSKAIMIGNAKTLNMLHCSLDAIEFYRIVGYKYAEEVWEMLQETYNKGTENKKYQKERLTGRFSVSKHESE